MNPIIGKAIKKITEEMMENQNNTAIRVIEEHLTSICTTNEVAEKILNKEKTLRGALGAIKNEAQKEKVGNCACIDDKRGFEIVEKYFGIEEEDKKINKIIDIIDLI